MKDNESLSIRGEGNFGEFMSKVLEIVGQIVMMSGGAAVGLLLLSPLFVNKKPALPYTLLMIMVLIGVFIGPMIMILANELKRR